MKFILATTNAGKAGEILEAFDGDHTVLTLSDIGFTKEIIEDGNTFEENAKIKVKAIYSWLPSHDDYDYIIADDSGLMIDALDGEPGLHTAYWMGADIPYAVRNKKAIQLLEDVPKDERTARFISTIAYCCKDGNIQTVSGVLEGLIAQEEKGDKGFGYDPIFYVPGIGKNLAELSKEEKNKISHRAVALAKMCKLIGVEVNL